MLLPESLTLKECLRKVDLICTQNPDCGAASGVNSRHPEDILKIPVMGS